ncbi:hypothetical protein GOQ04_06205 [Emticicia sp. ODNR4P]|nr:hypothetical protein [Emticicia sp. ODNR4P]
MYEVIYNKTYLSLSLCLIAWLAFRFRPQIESFFDRIGKTASFSLLAFIFRILPFLVVYVYYGFDAQSDVQIFWRSAQKAKELGIVYRDFPSLYSPLFAYVTAIPVVFWDTARAVTLLMIIIELLILLLTMRTYRNGLSNGEILFKTLIYLCFPAPFIFCVIGGQEDIWMWGFACLMVWAWLKGKSDFILGVIVALGLIVTKAFFVLFVPPIFLKLSNRWNFILGMATLGIPTLAFLYLHGGTAFLMPIQLAQEPMCPNIWSVTYPILGELIAKFNIRILNWIGLFVIIGVSCWQAVKFKNLELKQFVPFVWLGIFGVMMIFQIGAYSNYIFIYAMPMLFGLVNFEDKKFFVYSFIIQTAAVLQPSLWFRIGKPFYTWVFFLQAKFTTEYILQLIIFFGIVYWMRYAYQQMKKAIE